MPALYHQTVSAGWNGQDTSPTSRPINLCEVSLRPRRRFKNLYRPEDGSAKPLKSGPNLLDSAPASACKNGCG